MDYNNGEFDDAGMWPPEHVWNGRKGQFRNFEGGAIGEGKFHDDSHDQINPLILEMEHTYCAGAWVATIIMAQTIIEIALSSHGYTTHLQREQFLKKYDFDDQAKKLRAYRNSLVHRDAKDEAIVTIKQILLDRETLRLESKRAVYLSLNIALLGYRYKNAYK